MKKILSVVVMLSLVFSLAACGSGSPADTVKTFCEGVKKMDLKQIQRCLKDQSEADQKRDYVAYVVLFAYLALSIVCKAVLSI